MAKKTFFVYGILTALILLPLPPLVSGLAFLLPRKGKAFDEFADFRALSEGDPSSGGDLRSGK
jgi:hypothetical protein